MPGTLVLFEAPHRLPEMLSDAADVLGGTRPAAVARELTKLFETVRRGDLAGLAADYAASGPPKGEVVVVIGTAPEDAPGPEHDADLDARIAAALARHSIKDAASLVADETGLKRREVYAPRPGAGPPRRRCRRPITRRAPAHLARAGGRVVGVRRWPSFSRATGRWPGGSRSAAARST